MTILTDSQTACRSYQIGRISSSALHILNNCSTPPDIRIVWASGHAAIPGNEAAHAAARDLIHRAVADDGQSPNPQDQPQPLSGYADMLAHYRKTRCRLPPPHWRLSREEATTWRRLQTNTYPHPTRLHLIFPAQHPSLCAYCPQPGSLYHIVWTCQNTPDLPKLPNPSFEQWRASLASPGPDTQLKLVTRARTASRSQGIPD